MISLSMPLGKILLFIRKRFTRRLILCVLLILSIVFATFAFDHYQKAEERRKQALSAPAPLRILIEEGQTCPAILIYTENFGLGGENVIVSVWRGGRIVWSKDQFKGGPPYFEGRIPSIMVTKTLNEIERSGFFDDPFLNIVDISVDPKLEVISIIGWNKVLCMEAAHKWQGDGLDRSKHFCRAYFRIRNLVGSLIPGQGKEFKFNYKIERVFRY